VKLNIVILITHLGGIIRFELWFIFIDIVEA
jgi:hypothetical protein